MKHPMLVALLLLIGILLLAPEALAIPAFARKYDMSCATCHAPFPKLKPYGDQFAGNGFQLEGQEPARYTRDTGDDLLLLMRELPAALRMEGYVRYQPEATDRSDFQMPYLLKFLSGGLIAKDIAYYFYFFFGERGEVAGLEDAFVFFNNVGETDLDVAVGQFQVCDPIVKRELRLTFEDYEVYRTPVGFSTVRLTYDRGIFLDYALPTGTDLALAVVNGSGIGPADGMKNFDTDRYKNVMLHVAQDVGDLVSVGAFGYYGNERRFGTVNRTTFFGPQLSLATEKLEVNAHYVERTDSRPFFSSARDERTTRGAFGELTYLPEGDKSRWYGVALLNWVESDVNGLSYRTVTVHGGYLVSRNLRLVGEYTYDLELKGNRLTVGFVSAF